MAKIKIDISRLFRPVKPSGVDESAGQSENSVSDSPGAWIAQVDCESVLSPARLRFIKVNFSAPQPADRQENGEDYYEPARFFETFLASGSADESVFLKFHGYEPTVYYRFITGVRDLANEAACDRTFHFEIETSLLASRYVISELLPAVERWKINLQTLNHKRYLQLTGQYLSKAMSNLRLIAASEDFASERFVICWGDGDAQPDKTTLQSDLDILKSLGFGMVLIGNERSNQHGIQQSTANVCNEPSPEYATPGHSVLLNNTPVAGVRYYVAPDDPIWKHLVPGVKLRPVAESENEYDPNAVKLCLADSRLTAGISFIDSMTIGYIPRHLNHKLIEAFKTLPDGWCMEAVISACDPKADVHNRLKVNVYIRPLAHEIPSGPQVFIRPADAAERTEILEKLHSDGFLNISLADQPQYDPWQMGADIYLLDLKDQWQPWIWLFKVVKLHHHFYSHPTADGPRNDQGPTARLVSIAGPYPLTEADLEILDSYEFKADQRLNCEERTVLRQILDQHTDCL